MVRNFVCKIHFDSAADAPLRQTSSATFTYAADAPLLSLCDIFPVSSGTFTRFNGRADPKGENKIIKASFTKKYEIIDLYSHFFNLLP